MRKFWKLGLIVGIVAFMAGCSNLWDYVPPPRVDNTPVSSDGASGGGGGGGGGKPSGGGGGSGATRKVLTFNIKDVSGTTQEVKITVNANVDRVPLSDIEAAFNSQYPGLKPPFGVDLKWFQSGTPVTDPGTQYADNMTLTIDYDFPPGNKNYTVTLSTGNAGGKREFVTTDSDKPLSDILDKVGLAGPDYKPANPKPGWTFNRWEKVGSPVGSPNTIIDPAANTTPQSSGTNFVAVYNVPYTINIGGYPYTVKVPVAAPNDGATWADILEAAKADPQVLLAVGSDATKLDAMLWETGSSVADTGSTKRYPAGTAFTGENAISFNVGGQTVKVPVGAGETSATWEKIAAAAKRDGINVDKPAVPSDLSGGVFAEWQTGGAKAEELTSYPANSVFKPAFEVSYSISDGYTSYQHKEKVLEGVNTNKTLIDIFNQVNADNSDKVPSDGSTVVAKDVPGGGKVAFNGWRVTTPDGVTKIVHSSEIAGMSNTFPAGTKIKPNGIYQLIIDKGWGIDGVGMDFTWFGGSEVSFEGEGGSTPFTQIGDFYIANTEITRRQWQLIMSYKGVGSKDTETSTTGKLDGVADGTWLQMQGGVQWDKRTGWGDTYAMDYISWYDAIMLCNQLSRLNGRKPYYYLEVTETINSKVEKGIYRGDDFFQKLNDAGVLHSSNQNALWKKAVIREDPSADTTNPGFRLPTAEYWMYAAHGGDKVDGKWLYPTYSGTTGNTDVELGFVAWYSSNSGNTAHPVGTKGGDNPVRDMTGNVSEWCFDEYYNSSHLYIGGTYNTKKSLIIDAVLYPTTAAKGDMLNAFGPSTATKPHERYQAGNTGNRDTQGMRIIVPGKPGENYEDYFD